MENKKYTKYLIHKYRRFHVLFNKRMDKYFHNSIIVDMSPYDYKVVRKTQRKCNDHWSNFISTLGVILITILSFIIVWYLHNR